MYAHTPSEFPQGETFIMVSSTVLPLLSHHNIRPSSPWSWDDVTLLLKGDNIATITQKIHVVLSDHNAQDTFDLQSSYGKGLQKQRCLQRLQQSTTQCDLGSGESLKSSTVPLKGLSRVHLPQMIHFCCTTVWKKPKKKDSRS